MTEKHPRVLRNIFNYFIAMIIEISLKVALNTINPDPMTTWQLQA